MDKIPLELHEECEEKCPLSESYDYVVPEVGTNFGGEETKTPTNPIIVLSETESDIVNRNLSALCR